ncbi:hypothetical protein Tco_1108218 [Tanacetum coccineum]
MALYHALMESILADEDSTDQNVADTQKKRNHADDDRDEDPPTRSNQGLKRRKTSKDADLSKRSPTPDPEWNKGKSVDNELTQNWLSDLAKARKPPLTFNELMITPIDFSAYAMNQLKISNLTKADLVGPVYNLLKGTCISCVELEYNMEEFYKALTDQLDSKNPKGN